MAPSSDGHRPAGGYPGHHQPCLPRERTGLCPASLRGATPPFYPGFTTWADILDRAQSVPGEELDRLTASLDMDDPINIQYTSGTTGYPKAVALTHHNILNNAYFTGLAMHFTEKDRLRVTTPFYHCFGLVLANLVC